MKVERLETERLILRGYEESDISAWQKWDTDPEVQKYLPGPLNKPVTDKQQVAYLKECLSENNAVYWSIVWKENSEVIGTISFTDIDTNQKTAELNIIIGEKQYWGKGIATEAIKSVLDYAKASLGLQKVIAEIEVANTNVIKTLSTCGFVGEGIPIGSRIKYYYNLS